MCKWRMSSWIWTLSPDGPSRETAFFSAKNISKVAINSKMQWERNQKMSQFPDPKWNLLNWFSDSRVNYHLWKVILLSYLARNVTQFPRGVLPYKSGGVALRKISRTYQNLVLWACHLVTNSFPPLRGTNSTTTNYITGTANFHSNKDNFRTLSSQGRFESIVINLCLNQSFLVLAPWAVPTQKFKPLKGMTNRPFPIALVKF